MELAVVPWNTFKVIPLPCVPVIARQQSGSFQRTEYGRYEVQDS